MLRVVMFYAVKSGRQVGIYRTWAECEQQVKGYRGAKFKKFNSETDAEQFVILNSNKSLKNVNNDPIAASAVIPQISDRLLKPCDSSVKSKHVIRTNSISDYSLRTSANSATSLNIPVQPNTSISNELKKFMEVSTQTVVSCFGEETRIQALEKSVSLLQQQIVELNKQLNAAKNETGGRKRKQYDSTFSKRQKINSATSPKIGEDGNKIHVYTDGACVHNGKRNAAAGIGIYWGVDHPFNTSARLPGRQTNNRAEIQAAVMALCQAKEQGITSVVLYTDSQFLINGITKWIHGWKKNKWLLSTGEPVKNKDDFIDLEEAKQGLQVQWEYVRGHQGILGNEEADRLAVSGIKKNLP